jgi:hypothetical protein
MNWIPACEGMTYELDSRLRGNDLCVALGAIHVAHGAIHLCLPTDFDFARFPSALERCHATNVSIEIILPSRLNGRAKGDEFNLSPLCG